MDARTRARYSRQIRLPGFGEAGQAKLRTARVLLIGLGGLGSPASLYLAAAGVGRLGLADFDTVAEHNLQRQILHTQASVGAPKVASARERLAALNPEVELVDHPEGLTVANALELIGGYDVVVDGADNFPTRYLVNDAASRLGVPVVSGSIFQMEGQVTVWDPASGGPCYRCLFPEMPGPGEVPTCEEGGVLGALPGLIGSIQAMEVIKLVTGLGEPLRGRLLVWDAGAAAPRVLKIKRDPECPCCGPNREAGPLREESYGGACGMPEPAHPAAMDVDALDPADWPEETDLATARALLAGDPAPILLDVREADELAICRIGGCVHVPMRQVPEWLERGAPERPLVVLCHHGGRSLHVARYLRARGLHATNLQGGIDAWARHVDPAMARY